MEINNRVNLSQLSKMVAEKTEYNQEQCYEVLRCFADTVADVLVEGKEVSITRLMNVHFEYGTCNTELTGNKDVLALRTKCTIANNVRKRAKEAAV